MSMGEQKYFQHTEFISLIYIASYGSSGFNFLRNLHSGCTNLHVHHQCCVSLFFIIIRKYLKYANCIKHRGLFISILEAESSNSIELALARAPWPMAGACVRRHHITE
jgi:hypothetical protein